jgi:RNA polymerase sigma-70 factor (ECF subfamily)
MYEKFLTLKGEACMTVAEFEQFLEAYERDVFTFCKYLTANSDIASDLYQETVLAAFEMAERIDINNNAKSFLFSIAAGKWKNTRRKATRRQVIAPETNLDEYSNSNLNENPTAESALNKITRNALHNAISQLKEKFRVPLILYYFDNCPTETIGKICGIPAGTVKSRLHKAREILKIELEKEGISL